MPPAELPALEVSGLDIELAREPGQLMHVPWLVGYQPPHVICNILRGEPALPAENVTEVNACYFFNRQHPHPDA